MEQPDLKFQIKHKIHNIIKNMRVDKFYIQIGDFIWAFLHDLRHICRKRIQEGGKEASPFVFRLLAFLFWLYCFLFVFLQLPWHT